MGGRRRKLARLTAIVVCLGTACRRARGAMEQPHRRQHDHTRSCRATTSSTWPRSAGSCSTTSTHGPVRAVRQRRRPPLQRAATAWSFDADGDIYIGTDDIGIAKVRLANGAAHAAALAVRADRRRSPAIRSTRLRCGASDLVYGSTPGAGIIRNDFAAARYFAARRAARPTTCSTCCRWAIPCGWRPTGGVAMLDRLGSSNLVPGAPAEANVLGTDGPSGVGRDQHAACGVSIRPTIRGRTWARRRVPGPLVRLGRHQHVGGRARAVSCRYTGSGTTWTSAPRRLVYEPLPIPRAARVRSRCGGSRVLGQRRRLPRRGGTRPTARRRT